jgi:iron(III) transport system permease protein
MGLYVLQGGYIGAALVIPFVIMLQWGLGGVAHGRMLQAALTTAGLGLGAGCVALVLGGLPARWAAQRGGGGRRTELLAYGVSGLPGVLTAFGFLHVVQVLPLALAQALEGFFILLLLGLGIRFLAHPYGLLKPAFLREDPRPIEAAQTLGASDRRIFWTVRRPTLAPAAAAGFLLAFIAAIKELPITLMLLPAGHHTLATIIYDGHEDAHLSELGASAIILLAMVLVAQSLLRRWSDHD